ncbi:MAG TPA: error-prone DNA polymerase, partial [Sphingomonas sp.]|nr:error-prone DNA polymerase [Sphingomonas sp.]
QRPGKGNAIFVTIEDETGVTNGLIWARDFEAYRREVMAARLMVLDGIVQRSEEGVTHLIANRISDRSDELARLSSDHVAVAPFGRGDEATHPQPTRTRAPLDGPAREHRASHPREVRVMPKSRDFH